MRTLLIGSLLARTPDRGRNWNVRPYILRSNTKRHRGRYYDGSVGAIPDWLREWDSSAAVEGGLILSIGISLFQLARSKVTGQGLPQRLPPEPGKWAAIGVIGALPALQWMVRRNFGISLWNEQALDKFLMKGQSVWTGLAYVAFD